VAQRIMDFSGSNQIMLSRAFYDVISRISDGAESMFEYLGPRLDKHQRSHEIYALVDSQAIRQPPQAAPAAFEATRLVADLQLIPDEDLQAIESELALAIGPLAHVLFRKSAARANSAQDLRELLSVSIQDPVAREQFIHPKLLHSHRSSASTLVSGTRRTSASGFSQSVPAHSSVSQVSGSRSVPSSTSNLSPEAQAFLEQALSQYIGPLARTLVRKESARTSDSQVLLEALARHIDEAKDRAQFVAAVIKWQR
jgi:hypothetical protein